MEERQVSGTFGPACKKDQQLGTRTDRQENDGDDDDEDDHEPELSPAGLALILVRRRQLFRRSRRVHPDRRDVGLDVVCGTEPATAAARARDSQPVILVLSQGSAGGTQPIMPPCSTTSAPRSRKMSLSSWMPLSISRISVSRSLIWLSWNSSSCAGIWLLGEVAQAKGKVERCRFVCEAEERGLRAQRTFVRPAAAAAVGTGAAQPGRPPLAPRGRAVLPLLCTVGVDGGVSLQRSARARGGLRLDLVRTPRPAEP